MLVKVLIFILSWGATRLDWRYFNRAAPSLLLSAFLRQALFLECLTTWGCFYLYKLVDAFIHKDVMIADDALVFVSFAEVKSILLVSVSKLTLIIN